MENDKIEEALADLDARTRILKNSLERSALVVRKDFKRGAQQVHRAQDPILAEKVRRLEQERQELLVRKLRVSLGLAAKDYPAFYGVRVKNLRAVPEYEGLWHAEISPTGQKIRITAREGVLSVYSAGEDLLRDAHGLQDPRTLAELTACAGFFFIED